MVVGREPGTQYEGYTLPKDVPDEHRPALYFAGPWCEARWLAGRRPGWADLAGIDLRQCGQRNSDTRVLYEYGGSGPSGPEAHGVPELFEVDGRWDAVIALARTLLRRTDETGVGTARHSDVCEALGIREDRRR